MLEEIKGYRKGFVFDQYSRIIENFKDYERITKTKMLEAIYQLYEEEDNIIDLCTTRELKFLKKVISNNQDIMDDCYDWERTMLKRKFLLETDFSTIFIPKEIEKQVKSAISKFKEPKTKKNDQINELLVSYCKIQGSTLLDPLIQVGSMILGLSPEQLFHHMMENRVFRYYVSIFDYEIEEGNLQTLAVYTDYEPYLDELREERRKQGRVANCTIDLEEYQTLFYHDFNVQNPIIREFYATLQTLPCFWFSFIEPIQLYALFNCDRTSLKEDISNIPILKNYDLTDFFSLLDQAMDEMRSGALNGLTPNESKKLQQEEQNYLYQKQKQYQPQQNAHLSKQETKLFYKLYFGLLDFTNQTYQINPHFKIYKQEQLNPQAIVDVIQTFWEHKQSLIQEFCQKNPFYFNQKELKLVQAFEQGLFDTFMMVAYEPEYTAFMNRDKTYMVKGLHVNLDTIIPYQDLPYMVMTALIPFQNQIVYDGLMRSCPIQLDLKFRKDLEKEYQTSLKNYHL